jgi:hypothetical protein
MTVKIDGTNGVLQAYDYQVLTTGFTYTFAAGTQVLVAVPAATLATGTITMPSAPGDGMVITIQSSQQITALTLNGNTGQSVVGTAVQIVPNQPLSWVYRLANTTWYPITGGAGRASSVVTGTSVASTSGTSIDFTSIPSWVKRITVMFNGVSTNGSSNLQIQLGYSGGVVATGYVSQAVTTTGTRSTTGLLLTNLNDAAGLWYGQYICSLQSSSTNAWVGSGAINYTSNVMPFSAGSLPSMAGVLTQVRITTVNGTDTFDAGSINILYE